MNAGTKLAIVIIMFVLGNVMAPDGAGAQANTTECARLQKLLDQYAHVLFLNSPGKDGRSPEVGEKELLGEFQKLNLPEDTMTKTQSMLTSIKQCYCFAGSAAYGMKGFLTDLRFRMGQDAELRKKCSHVEDQYKKLLQECGVRAPE